MQNCTTSRLSCATSSLYSEHFKYPPQHCISIFESCMFCQVSQTIDRVPQPPPKQCEHLNPYVVQESLSFGLGKSSRSSCVLTHFLHGKIWVLGPWSSRLFGGLLQKLDSKRQTNRIYFESNVWTCTGLFIVAGPPENCLYLFCHAVWDDKPDRRAWTPGWQESITILLPAGLPWK